jgi:drug/metabolite transporter (DMT)-like permease
MKPALLALVAVTFFATENFLIQRYIAKVSPLINLAIGHTVIGCVCMLLVYFGFDRPQEGWTLPQGNQWWIVILVAALFALGDYFYMYAFNQGGSLATVTIMVCLIPVIATCLGTVVNWLYPMDEITAAAPTLNEAVGWLLGTAAVAVVLFKPFGAGK